MSEAGSDDHPATVISQGVPDAFSVPSVSIPPGTVLNGIYIVDERIARGGMGEVYAGRNVQTGYKVAIKMILPEHAEDELIIGLFRREADVLHDIHHEAIVRYFLFSVDPVLGRSYLVMEYAEGPSLADHLKKHGAMSREDLDTLRCRIADGLHAAHKQGVFHRDISPDNIILIDGQVEKAKIIDFGIAKSSDSKDTLIGSSLAGKMNYISPEQLGLNGGVVSAKSDIYSLGLVLAQASTGQPLSMTGSQVDIIDKRRDVPDLAAVPGHVRSLIQAMLAPAPEGRPEDMAMVADWDGKTFTGRRRPVRSSGRGRWLQGSVIAASVLIASGLLIHEVAEDYFGIGPTVAVAAAPRIVLEPVQEEVVAPAAKVGEPYDWSTASFAYSGAPEKLLIRSIGRVPPGLIFSRDAEGVSKLAGTPTESGSFSFLIDAESPSGLVAEQVVILNVDMP